MNLHLRKTHFECTFQDLYCYFQSSFAEMFLAESDTDIADLAAADSKYCAVSMVDEHRDASYMSASCDADIPSPLAPHFLSI